MIFNVQHCEVMRAGRYQREQGCVSAVGGRESKKTAGERGSETEHLASQDEIVVGVN